MSNKDLIDDLVSLYAKEKDSLPRALLQLAKMKDDWFISFLNLIRGECFRRRDLTTNTIDIKDIDKIILDIRKKVKDEHNK